MCHVECAAEAAPGDAGTQAVLWMLPSASVKQLCLAGGQFARARYSCGVVARLSGGRGGNAAPGQAGGGNTVAYGQELFLPGSPALKQAQVLGLLAGLDSVINCHCAPDCAILARRAAA